VILETGAELIGLNHPVCIVAADPFGYALGVVSRTTTTQAPGSSRR
jgi:hypothetical protein